MAHGNGSADSLAAFSSALLVGTAIENYNEKESGIGKENYHRICDRAKKRMRRCILLNFDVGFRIRKIDIDHQELKELLTRKLVHPNIYEEDQEEEEFEANHDYIPGFLEALGNRHGLGETQR